MEDNVWQQVTLAWSQDEGLEVTIDGVIAGQNTSGAPWTTTEPGDLQVAYLSRPNDTHSAMAWFDDIRYWDSREGTQNVSTVESVSSNVFESISII